MMTKRNITIIILVGLFIISLTATVLYNLFFKKTVVLQQPTEITNISTPVADVNEINTEGFDATDQELVQQTQEYYQTHPLMNYLPFDNDHFSFDVPDANDIYTVILFIEYNEQKQPVEFKKQYQKYQQEVLAWLKDKKIDPASLNINWKVQQK